MTVFRRDKEDLGALPADLAELLARGSGHVEHLDPAVRARLRARLLAPSPSSAGTSDDGPQAGAAPSSGASAGRALLAKPLALVLTTFALGMGSGAVLHGWLRASTAPAMSPPVQAAAPVVVAPPALSASPSPPAVWTAPLPARAACPAPMPRAPDREREDDGGLGRERALLDEARAALVGGDPGRALAALDRHRRAFPEGRLAEERDVLRVRSLAAAGRAKEARAEGARFLRKHPASLFRPAVEQTIAQTDFQPAPNEGVGGLE
jgi:hypothetical protein